MPAPLIRALGVVKKAAALANRDLGKLDEKLGAAIAEAADEVIDGKLTTSFRSPSGRPARARSQHERQRGDRQPGDRDPRRQIGSKDPVHPNDHVNAGQSSNDTFPTAMHIAVGRGGWRLIPALNAHARGAAREGGSLRRYREDRPHAHCRMRRR
jgi:fumarate hydratase class II